MKDGSASASSGITFGTPATVRISGRVTAGGQPLADVRVSDGTRNGWSDSDGRYVLVNVPAGSYTLGAVRFGYALAPSGFANPLTAPATNADFVATATTHSIRGETIQGALFGVGGTVAGVTVHAGPYSAVSDANGRFAIDGVPNGFYHLDGAKGSDVYVPLDPSVVEVYGGDVTNRFLWNGPMPDGGVGPGDGGSAGSDGGGMVGDGGAAPIGRAHGCGCALGGAAPAGRAWLLLLVVLVGKRRRRKR
jgi:MYXO-CTERM domain-containing protein